MLQAKGPVARTGEDAAAVEELDVPSVDVSGAVASARGDFLERLAAANKRAQALDRRQRERRGAILDVFKRQSHDIKATGQRDNWTNNPRFRQGQSTYRVLQSPKGANEFPRTHDGQTTNSAHRDERRNAAARRQNTRIGTEGAAPQVGSRSSHVLKD